MTSNTQSIDLFDPANLRMDFSGGNQLGIKKPLVHVPVRKPSRQEFFRANPAADYRMPMAILDLKEEREVYAVIPAVALSLPGETKPVELRLCISRTGTIFLWPVILPTDDGRENPWHQTARAAAEYAEQGWTRMVANMSAGCYDITVATANIPEPEWPEAPFADILRVAFGNGRLIDTMDHPVIQRLQGL